MPLFVVHALDFLSDGVVPHVSEHLGVVNDTAGSQKRKDNYLAHKTYQGECDDKDGAGYICKLSAGPLTKQPNEHTSEGIFWAADKTPCNDVPVVAGSMVVVEAASRAVVMAFVENDPFTTSGTWCDVQVHSYTSPRGVAQAPPLPGRTAYPAASAPLRLNTSNMKKFAEFERMFTRAGKTLTHTAVDLREIDADEVQVVAHKASCAGEGVIIEDTSFDVEGADVGVNIRWLLDNLDQHVGKAAVWRVLLAVLRAGGQVQVYEGLVHGTIVPAPPVDPLRPAFGFDPVFRPLGCSKTLAEDKPDCVSARAKAVAALLADDEKCTVPAIVEWTGPWQDDDEPPAKKAAK